MGDKSKIQWTEATWNVVTGCTKVSPACANCYIENTPPFRIAGRRFVRGDIPLVFHEDRLELPLRWTRPRRIFVNSLSDLFHENIPYDFVAKVFAVMALAPQHIFQVLTKRPERMWAFLANENGHCGHIWSAANVIRKPLPPQHWYHVGRSFPWPLPNVWLGVSVENQHFADQRIPILLQTPAAVRWVSYEPALAPVDFTRWLDDGWPKPALNWIVVGGESGAGSRPFDVAWARAVLDQRRGTLTKAFIKQLGKSPVIADPPRAGLPREQWPEREWPDGTHFGNNTGNRLWNGRVALLHDAKGGNMAEWPDDLRVREYPSI